MMCLLLPLLFLLAAAAAAAPWTISSSRLPTYSPLAFSI